MKYCLDHLWECLDTFNTYASEEEREILSVVAKKSELFIKSINEQQTKLFEDYQNSLSELNIVCQKNAFIKGIKFATAYLLEATEE